MHGNIKDETRVLERDATPLWIPSVLKAIGIAGLLGAGATIINTSIDNAKQDVRIENTERSFQQMQDLAKRLDETNSKLDRVIGKMEANSR
jgi:hypothetical protein